MSTHSESKNRVTVPRFTEMKTKGQKITMLTAYDYSMASLLDQSGIDAILVGDSLSMVVQGKDSTLPVTLDEMIYHAEMVGRAVKRALVVVDMPFPTNHLGVPKAVESASRIVKETRAQAVKLEGGADQSEVIQAITRAGIPVMGHVGLRPQSIHQLGSYHVQRDEEQLMEDARAVEAAGAFSLLLECIPESIATRITSELSIATIGIGAGVHCDGQILVVNDVLGMTEGRLPKHVRVYAQLRETIANSVQEYCRDVRESNFPGEEQTFK